MKNTLFNNYFPLDSVYDEMAGADIRRHYRAFVSSFTKLGSDEVALREDMAKNLFMKQGILLRYIVTVKVLKRYFPLT